MYLNLINISNIIKIDKSLQFHNSINILIIIYFVYYKIHCIISFCGTLDIYDILKLIKNKYYMYIGESIRLSTPKLLFNVNGFILHILQIFKYYLILKYCSRV